MTLYQVIVVVVLITFRVAFGSIVELIVLVLRIIVFILRLVATLQLLRVDSFPHWQPVGSADLPE